jgi:RNA polymerase sigma-70 factor (ECF subfamily)
VVSRAEVEELYRRHAGELHGYLYRRAGQAGADLLADVFVVALQRIDDLPEPAMRRAWLYGTARRLLLARSRESRKRQAAEHELLHLSPGNADSGEVPSARTRAVRTALASLREKDRELIRLTEWEQLSIAEAALVLDLKSGTARVRLHRARRSLATHPAVAGLFDPTDDHEQSTPTTPR